MSDELFFNGVPPDEWAEWYLGKIPEAAKTALLRAIVGVEPFEVTEAMFRDPELLGEELRYYLGGPALLLPLEAPE